MKFIGELNAKKGKDNSNLKSVVIINILWIRARRRVNKNFFITSH
jgi:hypothetical protein